MIIKADEIFNTMDGIHRMIWGWPSKPSPLWTSEQWVEIIEAIEMTKQVAIYRLTQRLDQDGTLCEIEFSEQE